MILRLRCRKCLTINAVDTEKLEKELCVGCKTELMNQFRSFAEMRRMDSMLNGGDNGQT